MRESKEAKLNGEKTMENEETRESQAREERKEDWIQDNLKDLEEDFKKENFDPKSTEFQEYCENRWTEDGE